MRTVTIFNGLTCLFYYDSIHMLWFVAPVLQPLVFGLRFCKLCKTPNGGESESIEEVQLCTRLLKLAVNNLNAADGETVTFDKVLFIGGENVKVGAPFVEGATVTGKVEKHGRQKKIIVFKYKAKKNYRKKQGHRQPYTKVTIEKIQG